MSLIEPFRDVARVHAYAVFRISKRELLDTCSECRWPRVEERLDRSCKIRDPPSSVIRLFILLAGDRATE
jgi:hypothetical protein